MPGLAGIASIEANPDLPQSVAHMCQPLLRRADFTVEGWHSDHAAIGVVRRSEPGRIYTHGSTTLAWTGMLLEDAAPPDRQAEWMLKRFRMRGAAGLAHLNGSYTAAVWEGEQRRLTLVRDRTGSHNLYYAQVGGRLLFATEIKAITGQAGIGLEPDALGMVDLLLWEHTLETRTLLEDIHALPPAAALTYQDGSLGVDDHWDMPVGEYRPANPEAIAAEWAERVRTAVRRAVVPGSGLLITGGLDSRLAAAAARQAAPDQPLQTASLGAADGWDVVIGAEVAAALGLPHAHVPVGSDYIARYAALQAWRLEGKLNVYTAWIMAAEEYAQQAGWRRTLTGLLGNTMSGRHFPEGLGEAKSLREAAAAVSAPVRKRRPDLALILRPEVYARTVEESAEMLGRYFEPGQANGRDAYACFDKANMHGQVARYGQRWDILGDGTDPVDPFMDRELVNFFVSIPPALRAGGKLYGEMIARYFPEVAGLRLDRTGRSLNANLRLERFPWLAKADLLARRLRRRLQKKATGEVAHRSIRPNEALREGSRPYVQAVLAQTELYDDLFDPRGVQQLFADHLARRKNAYFLLCGVITHALWRQQICAGAPAAEPNMNINFVLTE